jgi:hypothetical protein
MGINRAWLPESIVGILKKWIIENANIGWTGWLNRRKAEVFLCHPFGRKAQPHLFVENSNCFGKSIVTHSLRHILHFNQPSFFRLTDCKFPLFF